MWKFDLAIQTLGEIGFVIQKLVSSSSAKDTSGAAIADNNSEDASSASLVIAWCTATGTAKRYALLTSVDAQQEHGIRVACCNCCSELSLMASVGPRAKFFLLMFVATQGEGDAPPSLGTFQRMFEAECCPEVAPSSPRMIGFHVVALGDSSYKKFAEAGKRAATWLAGREKVSRSDGDAAEKEKEHGAEEEEQSCRLTLCDARLGANAAEELVENAVSKLLTSLTNQGGLMKKVANQQESSSSSVATMATLSPVRCSFEEPSELPPARAPFPPPSTIMPASSSERPVEVKLLSCQVLSKKTAMSSSSSESTAAQAVPRTVVRLVFDAEPLTSRSPLRSGDHVAIAPSNSPDLVERCARALLGDECGDQEKMARAFAVRSTSVANNRATGVLAMPAAVTFLEALQYFPDLTGPPRKRFVSRVLSTLCATEKERSNVRDIVAGNGNKSAKFVTVVDVVEAASKPMPLDEFFFLCPRLMPRFFSVSDSWFEGGEATEENNNNNHNNHHEQPPLTGKYAKKHQQQNQPKTESRLSLMVALVDGGCFSHMIERLMNSAATTQKQQQQQRQERFFFSVRHTSFHPLLTTPARTKPTLFIGAGTGIAPFVGFLREMREHKHLTLTKKLEQQAKNKTRVDGARKKFAAAAAEEATEAVEQEEHDGTAPAAAAAAAAASDHESPLVGNRLVQMVPAARAARMDSDESIGGCSTSSRNREEKARALCEQRRTMWPAGILYGYTRKEVGSPFLELFQQAVAEGTLSFLEEAESRPLDKENRTKKAYVQDRLSDLKLRRHLVDFGGSIFICGRSSMAQAVETCIVDDVLVKGDAGMSKEGATRFMQQLRSTGRLKLDVWE